MQLDHWQREAVRAARRRRDGSAGWRPSFRPTGAVAQRIAAAALLRGNLLLPGDARGWFAILGGPLPPLAPDAASAIAEAGPAFFDAALATYSETGADLAALAERLKSRTGRKGKALFMPLRFALTGATTARNSRRSSRRCRRRWCATRLAGARTAARD